MKVAELLEEQEGSKESKGSNRTVPEKFLDRSDAHAGTKEVTDLGDDVTRREGVGSPCSLQRLLSPHTTFIQMLIPLYASD